MAKAKKSNFDWTEGNPKIEGHSKAKLKLLHDYILEYLEIMCSNHRMDKFVFTLVDGFAGGGRYKGGTVGSPIVMWNAVREFQEKMDKERKNPIKIIPHFVFVDSNAYNLGSLRKTLEEEGVPQDVYSIHKGEFAACYGSKIKPLIEKRHPKEGGGVLFFLDQCGYTDVPIKILRDIKRSSRKSEVLINIAIQNIIDHMNDSDAFIKGLRPLGLSKDFINRLLFIKGLKGLDFRHFAEVEIAKVIKESAEFEYFTPYYIEPELNHRGYWLLHLAQNYRAHNAIMEVIWHKNGNNIRHYGGIGFGVNEVFYKEGVANAPDMFGETFSRIAYKRHQEGLQREIPKILRDHFLDGITVEKFIELTCNAAVADVAMFLEAIAKERGMELIVRGAGGGKKTAARVSSSDIILPNQVGTFDFGKINPQEPAKNGGSIYEPPKPTPPRPKPKPGRK